jgi:hypothetical protein
MGACSSWYCKVAGGWQLSETGSSSGVTHECIHHAAYLTWPGFARVDASLNKTFTMAERVNADLKLESYNAFNGTDFNARVQI